MKKAMMAGIAACAALAACAAPGPMKDGRSLVWSDEFNGGSLDTNKWRFCHTMNESDCVFVNDSRTVRMEDGCLHMQIHASGNPEKPWMLPEGVATLHTMAFKYGYLEMRARIPYRHGAWPGFWMQSPPMLRKVDWLAEVDIFEVFASSNSLAANIHKWGRGKHVMVPDQKHGGPKRDHVIADCARLNEEFHVYGFEWNPKEMKFYMDGHLFSTIPIDEEHDFGKSEIPGMKGFQDFQSVIFNNELFTKGHGWCPPELEIRPEDPLPIDYWVDWIRLWQNPRSEYIVTGNF